jgi:hypothetical protein
MKRLGQYFNAFSGDLLALMSGSPTVPLAVLAFYVNSQTLKILFASLAVICGFVASFRVWAKERSLVEEETAKRGRPELIGSFNIIVHPSGHFRTVMLCLKNSSPAPAVGIHIDDIRNGTKVMRFFPPESIVEGEGENIECQILENGWKGRNNMADLLDAQNATEHIQRGKMQSDILKVRVVYQNLDTRLAQKTWVLMFDFWFDYTQQRIFSGSQSLEPL